MYPTLLILHSFVRWIVVAFILYSIFRALSGYTKNKHFTKTDDAFRHWTATVGHIQLMIGILLYTQSPVIKAFWADTKNELFNWQLTFYSLFHIVLMLIAILLLTIGSALAKRRETDKEKFRTLLVWFTISLVIIFIAIPWPFSPLSNRPLLRTF